jgi:hypothetical protein
MAAPKPKPNGADPGDKAEERPILRSGVLKKFDRSLLHQPQGPNSGLNAVMGKWPGDETEEEILALLEELS